MSPHLAQKRDCWDFCVEILLHPFSQTPYEKASSSSRGLCLAISFPSVLNRCKMPLKISRGRWRRNFNEATASWAGIRVDDAVASVLSFLCSIFHTENNKIGFSRLLTDFTGRFNQALANYGLGAICVPLSFLIRPAHSWRNYINSP